MSAEPTQLIVEFLKAVGDGDLSTVQALVAQTPSLPQAYLSHSFGSGLIVAATAGRLECVRYLLPLSDPEAFDRSGRNALMMAALRGHLDCLEALLPVCNANAQNSLSRRGARPLSQAIRADAHDCIRALLEHTDLSTTDSCGHTVLDHAVERPHTLSTELLLPLFGSLEREAALRHAAAHGTLANVQLLCEACDPCAIDESGNNALMRAAHSGHDDCVKALLPFGGTQQVDLAGRSALALALTRRANQYLQPQSLSLLFACGARLLDNSGLSPLLHAAHACRAEFIKVLAPHSEVLARDREGRDALLTLFLYYQRPRADGVEPPLRALDALVPFIDDGGRLQTIYDQIKPADLAFCPQLLARIEQVKLGTILNSVAQKDSLQTSFPTAMNPTPSQPLAHHPSPFQWPQTAQPSGVESASLGGASSQRSRRI